LAFEETSVLASLAGPLAKAGISIFTLSTFDTDYLMVLGRDLQRAIGALAEAGHTVHQPGTVGPNH
jgi:hypothetical protein